MVSVLEDRYILCKVIINMMSYIIMYDVIGQRNLFSFKIVYNKKNIHFFFGTNMIFISSHEAKTHTHTYIYTVDSR